jgi:basic membrane protein A
MAPLLAVLAVAAMPVALAACGDDDDDGGGGGSTAAETQQKAAGNKLGLLMDVLRNDKSFGQATYEGAQKAAKDLDLELTVVDNLSQDPRKAETALQNMTAENDVVVNGAVATFGVLPRIAEQNADKQFGVYAVAVPEADNLHYAYQDWYPLGYQAGAVAATATKSKVIGFVGGGEIPPTIAAEQAFKEAIKEADPDIKVLSVITGDFNDPAKGRESTAAQIAQKADVIYSFLDAGHEGAVQAVDQSKKDVKLISVIFPKCDFSNGHGLGDSVASQGQLVYELIKGMVEGTSENVVYGIQDPEVATFAFCPGEETDEGQAAADDIRERFTSGELETPPELREAQGEADRAAARAEGHHQAVRRPRRQRPRDRDRRGGRDPRPPRRERCREDDAHERRLRAAASGRGDHRAARARGAHPHPARRARARHRDGPPALQARRRHDRRREPRPVVRDGRALAAEAARGQRPGA